MSPTSDDRHYELDHLADLAENLLPDDEATVIRGHLDSCGSCRGDLDAILGVAPLLHSVAPAPMPPEVALRLDAALAHESASRAPAGVAAASLDDARRRAKVGADRSSRLRRAATALVGVAAVLGGAFVVGQNLEWLGGADDTATAGADSEHDGDESAAGGGSEESAGGDDPAAVPEPGAAASSELDYTASGLTDEVRSLLALATPPRLPGTDERPEDTATETDGVPDRAAAGGCLKAVAAEARNDGVPLAVDVSTFEGTDAVVIVLPPSDEGSDLADIWVVGTGCVEASAARLEVLDRRPFAVDSTAR